ncbi:ser/Thr protein phosphatase family [Cordyceps militaris CM01]|uniref:Ser/Thr protein phosphatase family n=1 Tax=Cordyceps militaris (strain CM01) TaxID=983644 RepID=G3JQ11_CORMM|nr:ser/Thr protein phosphatase family [Cordyceps militaris CM01]EGX89262.1 ser/Thr protein phosphatase family [Cordyceps militaris CM01]
MCWHRGGDYSMQFCVFNANARLSVSGFVQIHVPHPGVARLRQSQACSIGEALTSESLYNNGQAAPWQVSGPFADHTIGKENVGQKMKSTCFLNGLIAAVIGPSLIAACGHDQDSCYGPQNNVEYVRQVKRMQPGAPNATYGPKGPLEWGQINFMHTTDTHGWLEGHLKQPNYGADWGDFVTFTRRMKQTAGNMGVDLLLVDTGDLHDGTGLSDATPEDGVLSMPIFDEVAFDLLTIGNHELYVSEVAYQMFNTWARKWGDRYVTSNVQIRNPATGAFEYVGATHRYFTTDKGLRVMAFGVLFDFTGNSNASRVIKAADMVKEAWFADALHTTQPVDLFVLFGHNAVSPRDKGSTLKTVWDAIRAVHPTTPVSLFGGHSHIRDFAVYDETSVGIEAGRYCETIGWVAMTGFDARNSGYKGIANPRGVPNPARPAKTNATSPFRYARRYLDWNRNTFIYHSHQQPGTYDYHSGSRVTGLITAAREKLRLGDVYGCAPQSWCMECAPFDSPQNLFPGVIVPAVSKIVVQPARADKARIILGNTGSVRYDVPKGPFTYDDNFIVSPFRDVFRYLKDVPYDKAQKLIRQLNNGRADKRSTLVSMAVPQDACTNPTAGHLGRREQHGGPVRRQEVVTPGYVTKDDWGTDGDDTNHTAVPFMRNPGYYEARAGFPAEGSPEVVDVVFYDFIEKYILQYLGSGFNASLVDCYIDCNFTSQDFLLPYAKAVWQDNINDCPIDGI